MCSKVRSSLSEGERPLWDHKRHLYDFNGVYEILRLANWLLLPKLTNSSENSERRIDQGHQLKTSI